MQLYLPVGQRRLRTSKKLKMTLIFAPIYAVIVWILAWRINEKTFPSFKRTLILTTTIFWFAMWLVIASGLFWESTAQLGGGNR